MKKLAVFLKKAAAILSVVLMVSCSVSSEYDYDDKDITTVTPTQTIIVFMPWVNNLQTAFQQNISDIEKAITERHCEQADIIVCKADSKDHAVLYSLKRYGNYCVKE